MANTTQITDPAVTRQALERWYRTSRNGERLSDQLSTEMGLRLENMFGYHLVVLGVEAGLDFEALSRVQQIVTASPSLTRASSVRYHVLAEDEDLPFESDSVDVVVALHSLDLSPQPHQVLREIQRVLTPQGNLLLVGLNPNSLLGFWRRVHGWHHRSRWRDLAFLSVSKMEDWLKLLDFNCANTSHKLPVPSLGEGRFARWATGLDRWLVRHNAPLGSVYLVQATKLVRGHLHGGLMRRRPARLISIPVARPVAGRSPPVPRGEHRDPTPES